MLQPAHVTSLDRLRAHLRRIEAPQIYGVIPFRVAAIDRALPGGGLPLGALHEVLGAGADEEDGAAAAGFVAAILARLGTADREGAGKAGPGSGLVLWCLKRHDLYGLGLLAHGLDPARVVLVTARRGDDVLWSAEEALRAGPASGLVAVVAEIGRLPMVAGRRLQLAAERSGLTAFLLRRWRSAAEAATERERPSAALTRWRVTALPSIPEGPLWINLLPQQGRGGEIAAAGAFGTGAGRPRWHVELLRARGGVPGSWEVEIADATGHVRLSAGLADRPVAPHRPHVGSAIRRAG
ncbi:MAG: ImuA family protein [Alphaproteobacteria bacterium]